MAAEQDEEAVRAAHDLAAQEVRAPADLLAAGLLAAQLDPAASPERVTREAAPPPEEETSGPHQGRPARHSTSPPKAEGE